MAGRAAMAAAGQGTEGLLTRGDFTYASGRAAAATLLDATAPPTAIIASNDQMALAPLEVRHDRGITVSRDLPLVSVDDTPIVRLIHPPLAETGEVCDGDNAVIVPASCSPTPKRCDAAKAEVKSRWGMRRRYGSAEERGRQGAARRMTEHAQPKKTAPRMKREAAKVQGGDALKARRTAARKGGTRRRTQAI